MKGLNLGCFIFMALVLLLTASGIGTDVDFIAWVLNLGLTITFFVNYKHFKKEKEVETK